MFKRLLLEDDQELQQLRRELPSAEGEGGMDED